MMRNLFTRRRTLLHLLAGAALASASRIAAGEAAGAGPEKADAEPGKAAGSSFALTVIVTGDGRPIPGAEVKVKFPPAGSEAQLHTDSSGKAKFSLPGKGTATVRVIVTGWPSAWRDVELKEEAQELTIQLKPSPKDE